MENLEQMRKTIDAIDSELIDLFIRRMQEVDKIAAFKAGNALSVNDSLLEEQIIAKHVKDVPEKWQTYYRRFQNRLTDLENEYQADFNKQQDDFVKTTLDTTPLTEVVFKLCNQAEEERKTFGDLVVNATIGTLHEEDGPLTTLQTVYDSYSNVSVKRKAAYADAISGNPTYCDAVFNWLNRNNNINLPHTVIATPGGSGAVSSVFTCCLNPDEIVLIPEIAWGSYAGMATQNHLKVARYSMFDGEHFALDQFKAACKAIIHTQHKLLVVINDPCQNPTGLSLGTEVWKDLISFFNEISSYGKVVVLNDIAYIDFGYDQAHVTDYMSAFNNINENVAVIMAFSCSKALTAYGMRSGAAVVLAKEADEVGRLYNVFNKCARAFWSNINNGFMDCFVDVTTNHKDAYLAEKDIYIDLLKKRSEIFMQQAKECGLPVYPYQEGFFITLRVEDPKLLNRFNEALIQNHIFALKTTKGIRVAICSVALSQIDGLAKRMKDVYDTCL